MAENYYTDKKKIYISNEAYSLPYAKLNNTYLPPLSKEVERESIKEKTKIGSIALSRFEIICLLLTIIFSVTFIVSNLYFQYNNTKLIEATNNYYMNTSEIQRQSTQMTEVITQQFDYNEIKKTVEEENMKIDKSQIRTVE